MSVSFHEMGNHERMYSFVGDDGANIHVAVERLHYWVQNHEEELVRKKQLWLTPIAPAMVLKFIQAGLVNRERILSLTDHEMRHPIIYGKEKKGRMARVDMYLLDGRHRYVRAFHDKQESIKAYVLKPKQWMQFRISDIPDIDQETLNRLPVRSGPS